MASDKMLVRNVTLTWAGVVCDLDRKKLCAPNGKHRTQRPDS